MNLAQFKAIRRPLRQIVEELLILGLCQQAGGPGDDAAVVVMVGRGHQRPRRGALIEMTL